ERQALIEQVYGPYPDTENFPLYTRLAIIRNAMLRDLAYVPEHIYPFIDVMLAEPMDWQIHDVAIEILRLAHYRMHHDLAGQPMRHVPNVFEDDFDALYQNHDEIDLKRLAFLIRHFGMGPRLSGEAQHEIFFEPYQRFYEPGGSDLAEAWAWYI